MERNKFLVQVDKDKSYNKIMMEMDPSTDVMVVAEALSRQFRDCRVSVSMFARNRRVYYNGEVVASEPDLNHFYTECSGQDVWDWTCLGQVKD